MSNSGVSQQNLAKLSALYAGVVFGIYWIPLRALEAAGFSGLWATVALNLIPCLCILLPAIYRWRFFLGAGVRFHIAGVLAGMTFAFYAGSLMFTDVVRAVLLFYLTPIWGFLLARIVIGEAITLPRWAGIIVGLSGLLVMFKADLGVPLPQNLGDWLALMSGLVWAVASLMMLTDKNKHPINYGFAFLIWGTIIPVTMASIVSIKGGAPVPDWGSLVTVLYWLLPVAVLVILPATFATVYGPTQLNPGVVGLFFMTEISVATITAALFAGEPFGVRELIGVSAVTVAGLIEPSAEFLSARKRRLAAECID